MTHPGSVSIVTLNLVTLAITTSQSQRQEDTELPQECPDLQRARLFIFGSLPHLRERESRGIDPFSSDTSLTEVCSWEEEN